MKLSQMRHFRAVCEYNNVTRAALALHISQPSVSSSIRELEKEFGVNLFHRLNKRLSLTQEGEYFLEKVINILDQVDNLSAHMQDIGNKKNLIRIGVPPMIGTFLFPAMFEEFRRLYPGIKMEIMEHGSIHVQNLVKQDEVDMAIISVGDQLDPELNQLNILSTDMCFCVSAGHHLANRKVIDLSQLKDEPLILFKKDSLQNAVIARRFAEKGITPNVILSSSQLYTIQKFISKGNCGAFLFREIVELEPSLVGIPLADPITIDISLVWKKSRIMYSDAAKFIGFTKDYIPKINNKRGG